MLRIGGKTIDGPKQILLVLPRGDQGDVVFKFTAVLDTADFDKLCPEPKAPTTMKVGIGLIENVEDPKYKAALEKRGQLRHDWFFLQSVKPSDIEWTRIKMDDPSTWNLWETELKDAGFSVSEVSRIRNTFLECNIVSDEMVAEARLRFLHGLAEVALAKQPSLTSALENTDTGEPANAGESAPPG
jgi:hypothetical protein